MRPEADISTVTDVGPAGSDARRGLPDPDLHPPTVAGSGDPFAGLRVVHVLARSRRGIPVPVSEIVARLNAEYLDWAFSSRVVMDVVSQLRANWLADYRTVEGVAIEDGPAGPTVRIEESDRAAAWLAEQAWRLRAECQAQLDEFARGEGRATEG